MLRQHLLQKVQEWRMRTSELKCMVESHTLVLRIWEKKRDDAWVRNICFSGSQLVSFHPAGTTN